MTMRIHGDKIEFPDGTEQFTASSGGSTPTPEPLVWEDKKAERELDTVYTNDNDVPLYVQISSNYDQSVTAFKIDGKVVGNVGDSQTGSIGNYSSSLFIIPSKSNYELHINSGTPIINEWHEARMPLAIAVGEASGGAEAQPPVAFNVSSTTSASLELESGTMLIYDKVDTNEGDNYSVAENAFIAKKDGTYSFNNTVFNAGAVIGTDVANVSFFVNGAQIESSRLIVQSQWSTGSRSIVLKLNANDKVQVGITLRSGTPITSKIEMSQCSFSGHMVSSITEGEVKEKEPEVFKVGISAEQPIPNTTETKVELNAEYTMSNGVLSDGRLTPKVAGWYQINSAVSAAGSPASTQTSVHVYKNTTRLFRGTSVISEPFSSESVGSGIVYLNGTTDYLELRAFIASTNAKVAPLEDRTYLTAHLITGQSSGGGGGDSIWTEVGGEAVYDGNVKIGGALYTDSGLSIQSGAGEALTLRQGSDSLLRFNATGDGKFTKDIEVNGLTVGRGNNSAPSNNTAIGFNALSANTTGTSNSAVGHSSLKSIVSTNDNTAMGVYSLNKATGSQNTAIGYNAGGDLTTGSDNVVIGFGAQASSPSVSNEVTIGNNSVTSTNLKGNITINGKAGAFTTHLMYSPDKSIWSDIKAFDSGSVFHQARNGRLDLIGDTGLRLVCNSTEAMVISSSGNPTFKQSTAFDSAITSNGSVYLKDLPDGGVQFGNVVANTSDGRLYKVTPPSTYTSEEVDKKLAIKDKLIEKLSARLDKLEKRLKK